MLNSDQEIQELIKGMDKEVKDIKEDLFRLSWYMRGGITFSELYNMGIQEREIIGKIIKENLETTKKSGLPFF
jgi:hypothetical protein